eukprot:g5020.t1
MALETARRSLDTGAPEAALSEAKQVADAALASNDLRLAAEAISLQSLALLKTQRLVEARQLLQQQLSVTRTAGHQAAELILLAASSSAALAQNDLPTAKMTAEEGVALVKRLGSSFEKSNRKLLLQLLIAKGNAQLMDQNLPEAAKAAVEALTVGRASHDEEGQSAAQKAVAQVFHEGTPPLSSLESSNQAAALLRKLGDKEGEAIALLSIAECRLEAPNRPEALGAAQRARQLFREERHRRGRLQALELMARAWQETLPALEERESR